MRTTFSQVNGSTKNRQVTSRQYERVKTDDKNYKSNFLKGNSTSIKIFNGLFKRSVQRSCLFAWTGIRVGKIGWHTAGMIAKLKCFFATEVELSGWKYNQLCRSECVALLLVQFPFRHFYSQPVNPATMNINFDRNRKTLQWKSPCLWIKLRKISVMLWKVWCKNFFDTCFESYLKYQHWSDKNLQQLFLSIDIM